MAGRVVLYLTSPIGAVLWSAGEERGSPANKRLLVKGLTAVLYQGSTFVVIDNIEGELDGILTVDWGERDELKDERASAQLKLVLRRLVDYVQMLGLEDR